MKPLTLDNCDDQTLQNLGRASLQIIHDIKNQLNGLKLYATYLRKRVEKVDESSELQGTLGKLIAGIDRAATDLNVLVQYGRPIAVSKHGGIDILKLMKNVAAAEPSNSEPPWQLVIDEEDRSFVGEFDPTALTDAFRAISAGAAKAVNREKPEKVQITLKREEVASVPYVVVEWKPVYFQTEEPFSSFNGSDAIRMALAAKIVAAHGGSAKHIDHALRVYLPLLSQT